MKKINNQKKVLDGMKNKWPSVIVARCEVGKFSGGILNPRTLANLDSQGKGCKKMTLGRKVFYLVDDLIEWMGTKFFADSLYEGQ